LSKPVYFETSVFIEAAAKRSKLKKPIRELLKAFGEDKVRLYTSIITVQELSVAVFLRGAGVKDTYGDLSKIARIYTVTKEIALTAAKYEAALKDITKAELAKRDTKKPETEDEKLDRICENRRRKWDCIHLATAKILGCEYLYSTDKALQKRPRQLGIDMKVLSPEVPIASIKGPLVKDVGSETV
jgi:predicted nucleic acid-binding protein